ncbi:rho GTPase-activating protein 7 isoform 2 [Anopheles sinensis]|uniref:Rho GTPase-activating protein 7 isoform 2 n=1 Tax=Anopheles sinensis TaxID=74873 RepID=A0A084WMR4_ANOSI|nr:rho GTPase-activating protein 7 isoform 2 [Anopheles sinensis]
MAGKRHSMGWRTTAADPTATVSGAKLGVSAEISLPLAASQQPVAKCRAVERVNLRKGNANKQER